MRVMKSVGVLCFALSGLLQGAEALPSIVFSSRQFHQALDPGSRPSAVELADSGKLLVREGSGQIRSLVDATQAGLPEWVEVSDKEMRGIFKAVPTREDVLPDVNENLVVELYSK